MSTTFGVKIYEDDAEDDAIEIAFRSSWGIIWKNELAPLLPDNTPVIALDNSPQGIHTIGDIRKEIIQNE